MLVDDKVRILDAVKKSWGDRVTTVFRGRDIMRATKESRSTGCRTSPSSASAISRTRTSRSACRDGEGVRRTRAHCCSRARSPRARPRARCSRRAGSAAGGPHATPGSRFTLFRSTRTARRASSGSSQKPLDERRQTRRHELGAGARTRRSARAARRSGPSTPSVRGGRRSSWSTGVRGRDGAGARIAVWSVDVE